MVKKPTYEELEKKVKELEKQGEEFKTLQHHLTNLAQIISFLPDAAFVIDADGKVIAWNRAIEHMTGIKAQKMLGKGDYEYAIPFYGERRPILIDLVGKWDKEIEKKYQYVKKEGASLVSETYDPLVKPGGFFRNKASLLYDHNGEVIGAIESIRDITDKKAMEKALQKSHDKLEQRVEERTRELVEANEQMVLLIRQFQREIIEREQVEEALQESEEKYRSMMEAIKDPVYICSQDYRIEYMNPAMIRRTGQDATGDHCFKALHDLDEKCPWCMHDKIQPGEHLESEIVSPKDNRSYHVSSSLIVHEDGSISKITIFRDTTKMKETEARLQQAQKMEAIGTLAAGIAHDFNNVLYAIMGYTELTIDLTPEESKARGNLQEVLKAADRAKEMVQQILSFSRQRKKEKKPVSVQSVLKEAVNLLSISLPSTIEIRRGIDADCGPVMADPTQIHEIIMNLATNAYHAMREKGGVLAVNLRSVACGLRNGDLKENEAKTNPALRDRDPIPQGGTKIEDPDLHPGPYLKLTIEDTGHGIDSSVMEKIFDPYFTTKGVGEGTGMGLAVVYGIVRDHGGDIKVTSEPGKGTAFHVYLPLIETGTVEREIISAEEQAPTGTERILFVDDEEQIANMAREMLESLGYHITSRTSSVEALEVFRAKPNEFDLVITDMTMPNMTGAELAPKLMEIRPDIPIILCTGFSELIDEDRAKAMGIRRYVMKPVVKKEMAEAIRKALGKPNTD